MISEGAEIIRENVREVRQRIEEACRRAGRNQEEVLLIGVSKTKPFEAVLDGLQAGLHDFGENYVQELTGKISKAAGLKDGTIRWHMIGHLQKNKVKYLAGQVALIHSVDSAELAAQIEKEAEKKNLTADILLEVNVAEEASKWGFSVSDTVQAAEAVSKLSRVRLRGLMTSAPITEDPESNRGYFRKLRELAEDLDRRGLISREGDCGFTLPVLSMGMSGDYETAVEEGATMVRVGTRIFGEREYRTGTAE